LPALPEAWRKGSVSGLRARGGFEIVSLEWENGNITVLKIKSTLGGNCRLRVSDTLIADEATILKKASGKNPNPFFVLDEVAPPLISDKAHLNKPNIAETHLYDFTTQAGRIYTFRGVK
jgi:alpha-L-fucosidase 2